MWDCVRPGMSELQIHNASKSSAEPHLHTTDPAVMQETLAARGIGFQRWPARQSLAAGADQESILPMNAGKRVFQFRYRYPMIGGPAPIGYCLDETVEIADGLFLGQLIYSTQIDLTYHSAVDPAEYGYQLFGYFLLLDDDWQRHRLAIGLDVL